MLYPLFEVASFAFLLSVAVLFILEIAVAENDAPGWGFVWLIAWVALAVVFTDFNPLPWIMAHPIQLVLYAVGYVVCGVAYAFFRWWAFVRQPRSMYESDTDKPIQVSSYRDRIVTWMMWWPASLTWWLLKWPRELFLAVYNSMAKYLQDMANSAFNQSKKG